MQPIPLTDTISEHIIAFEHKVNPGQLNKVTAIASRPELRVQFTSCGLLGGYDTFRIFIDPYRRVGTGDIVDLIYEPLGSAAPTIYTVELGPIRVLEKRNVEFVTYLNWTPGQDSHQSQKIHSFLQVLREWARLGPWQRFCSIFTPLGAVETIPTIAVQRRRSARSPGLPKWLIHKIKLFVSSGTPIVVADNAEEVELISQIRMTKRKYVTNVEVEDPQFLKAPGGDIAIAFVEGGTWSKRGSRMEEL